MGDVILDRASTATADFSAQIERDLMGFEIGRRSGGISVSTQRDKLGRPIEQTIEGITRRTRSWKWGTANQLLSTVDSLTGSWNYTYNAQGFLTFAESSHFEKIVRAPDAIGNLFKENDRSDRKYGKDGRVLEVKRSDGVLTYEYDPEGNLAKKSEPNGVWKYDWNGSGMLSSVTRPDSTQVCFKYDALGRRIEKYVEKTDTTVNWIWDGNTPIHETITDKNKNRSSTEWLFDDRTFTLVGKILNGQTFTVTTDHLGTPIGMYDSRGSHVWQRELDIWGEKKFNGIGDSESCPFRYPGQYEDVETGLYYNRFRYFDPEIGSYITIDPIGLAGGNPTLYGYVSNPLWFIDPWGLAFKVFWSGGGKAQAAAESYASSSGAEVLEMTDQGKALMQHTKDMDWSEAEPLWQKTSASFAGSSPKEQTHAKVFIDSSNYRGSESVWEKIEKPILNKKGISHEMIDINKNAKKDGCGAHNK